MATDFTPLQSLIGGALIGTASVLLMLTLGRIAGATGILTGLFFPTSWSDFSWRAAIVLGMVAAPLVYPFVTGSPFQLQVPASMPSLAIGGLLVGIGATIGSGCTSGHGVCGLARLSLRSLAAVMTFMVVTFVMVFVIRHLLGA